MSSDVPLDKVFLEQLEVFARIGCTDAERAFPQRLVVDLQVGIDTTQAVRSDDIRDTVCYQGLADCVRTLTSDDSWALVERFAEDISAHVLRSFSDVQSVLARVRKFAVPGAACAGVEIVRQRT